MHTRRPKPVPCYLRSHQASGLVYGSETPPAVLLEPGGEREPALGRIEWGTTIREIEVGLAASACPPACPPAPALGGRGTRVGRAAGWCLRVLVHPSALPPPLHLQASVQRSNLPAGTRVLPVAVYIDDTLQEIGGRRYRPVNLTFPSLPRELVHLQGSYMRLGLLPELEADPDIGLKAKTVR